MKKMFLTGEVEYEGKGVQGKGFRSLGQEAIYAAALRLKRDACLYAGGRWNGDVVAPRFGTWELLWRLSMMMSLSHSMLKPANKDCP